MIIAIDAGHGPATAGKRSPDGLLREYTFNSAVANELQRILSLYNCSTFRTDNKDSDVPLRDRCKKVNDLKADVCVSIHANASGNEWSTAKGIETLIDDDPPATERYRESLALALNVQRRLVAATKLRDRGVKQRNDLFVLNACKCPTILIEAGFMTSREEVLLLRSESYRKLVAKCIAESLIDVYKLKLKLK
jgi:N-acetylmuramoyl-L-alanine amidase